MISDPSFLINTIIGIAVLFAMFVGFIVSVHFWRVRWRKARAGEVRRCRCGYALTNLEVPRCPECGVLVGFEDLKVQDLGMTEEELLAYSKKRRGLNPPSQSD